MFPAQNRIMSVKAGWKLLLTAVQETEEIPGSGN
jgi:hypothetical protein